VKAALNLLILGLVYCSSIFAITPETNQLLEGKRFACDSMDINEESLDLPSFLKGGEVSNGSVTFLEVNSDMVKVRFDYSIKGFSANHLYHITDAYEKEWMRDVIIGEKTEINGLPSEEDPFAVSIGTRVKIKKHLISGTIKEIWLKKALIGVSSPLKRKAIKCRIKEEPQTVEVEPQQDIFKQLYN
jgi:hypothetical protein